MALAVGESNRRQRFDSPTSEEMGHPGFRNPSKVTLTQHERVTAPESSRVPLLLSSARGSRQPRSAPLESGGTTCDAGLTPKNGAWRLAGALSPQKKYVRIRIPLLSTRGSWTLFPV